MNSKRVLIFAVLSATITTALILALVLPLMGRVMAHPQAGAPTLVSYQGYLTDEHGNPLTQSAVDLQFSIYTQENDPDNNYLWQEDHTVDVTDGYFTVMLGDNGQSLTASVFDDTERWLQIGVVEGSTVTKLPRQRLAAVPFALQAANADLLDSHDATYFATAGHSHAGLVTMLSDRIILVEEAKATGVYTFDLTTHGFPSDVQGVLINLACTFSSASYDSYCQTELTGAWDGTMGVNAYGTGDTSFIPITGDTLHVRVHPGASTTNTLTRVVILGYVK